MTITVAMLVEGSSDKIGLPILIERTVQHIVNRTGRYETDVFVLVYSEDDTVTFQSKSYVGRVVEAAQLAAGFSLLVLHRDADARTNLKTTKKYIKNALAKVQAARDAGTRMCEHIVPVIPTREMEAWLLCDPNALADVLGTTSATLTELGLPEHLHQLEAYVGPKELLNRLVKEIAPRADRDLLYRELAEKIGMQRLGQLTAHQEFVTAVLEKLKAQGLVALWLPSFNSILDFP